MVWLVILIALMIPLTAVVLDSPVVRAWVDRRHGGGETPLPRDLRELSEKVEALETELETVNRELAQLKEAQQFTQRLLENPEKRQAEADRLPDRPTG